MASIVKKEIQEKGNNKKYSQGSHTNIKASCLKNDAEFKKLFGLTKDLRVCLTRIPDHLSSGKSFNSFNSLMKSSSYKDANIVVKKEEKKQVTVFKVYGIFFRCDKHMTIIIFYLVFNVL
jgi:hypothetical protein